MAQQVGACGQAAQVELGCAMAFAMDECAASKVAEGDGTFGGDGQDVMHGVGIGLKTGSLVWVSDGDGIGQGRCGEEDAVLVDGHAVLGTDGDEHGGCGVVEAFLGHADGGVGDFGGGFDLGVHEQGGVGKTDIVVQTALVKVGNGGPVHGEPRQPGAVDEGDVVDGEGVVALASSG